MRKLLAATALGLLSLGWAAVPARLMACPFCNAVSQTLGQEIDASNAAVIMRRIVETGPAASNPQAAPTSRFEVVHILKEGAGLRTLQEITAPYFGRDPEQTLFYSFGVDPPNWNWSTPVPLSERAVEYVKKLPSLPKGGGERLLYFQQFLGDSEQLMARDSFDEFARAPYAELKQIKDQMPKERLHAWLQDLQLPASSRRLYLVMLAVCGNEEDIPAVEAMVKAEAREQRIALDAAIGCYLCLKGESGLPLVEDLFLKNTAAEYTDTYAAIMAIRFLGQEETVIPRERLVASLRLMLDRKKLADLVIPDLARWQDWSVMDRLVEMYKTANDDDSPWLRSPIVNYMRACPLPEAKTHIEEMAKIDPDAVARASSLFPVLPVKPATTPDTASGEQSAAAPAAGNGAASAAAPVEGSAPAEEPSPTDTTAEPANQPPAGSVTEQGPAVPAETESPAASTSAATQAAAESASLPPSEATEAGQAAPPTEQAPGTQAAPNTQDHPATNASTESTPTESSAAPSSTAQSPSAESTGEMASAGQDAAAGGDNSTVASTALPLAGKADKGPEVLQPTHWFYKSLPIAGGLLLFGMFMLLFRGRRSAAA